MAALPAPVGAEALISTAREPSGEVVRYVLRAKGAAPKYVFLLFPGGSGYMNPRMEDGALVYSYGANFGLRTRRLYVDEEFAAAAMDSTWIVSRVEAVIDDLKRRFPAAEIYLFGFSLGSYATMRLAGPLQDKVAGGIHVSSPGKFVGSFNGPKYRNRQLLVHHKDDACAGSQYGSALASHETYGTELLAMEGGARDAGGVCGPYDHHGFMGIERETIDRIKAWVRAGTAAGKVLPPASRE